MHRLKWSVIAKQSVCLVDRISMLLSQLLSQLPSASYMFEDIAMGIMSLAIPSTAVAAIDILFLWRHGLGTSSYCSLITPSCIVLCPQNPYTRTE